MEDNDDSNKANTHVQHVAWKKKLWPHATV